jgi:predicted MFS family arabinose efflux permease
VVLPPLRGHLEGERRAEDSTWAVATEPNHIRAFLLMLALVASSFVLVPFIATFLRFNVGLPLSRVKYMYLFGGCSTFITLPLFGRLSDRYGKLRVFRIAALACLIPFVWIPNLPAGASLPVILLATTSMFVFSSGRMVPAMALITNSAEPRIRGSFMSLNSAVQQLGAGAAAWFGGLLLNTAEGQEDILEGYPLVGLVSAAAIIASVFLAGRLRPAPGGEEAPDAEAIEPHHLHAPATAGRVVEPERAAG